MGRCAEAVNTDCLVESIQTYLVSGQDQFRRERVMQALASTQLFDGDVDGRWPHTGNCRRYRERRNS
ncbi:hypothetical protein HED63_26825 [Ochrobactrum cytisi]|nr:hypothetical protein [Brucella cytisi]